MSRRVLSVARALILAAAVSAVGCGGKTPPDTSATPPPPESPPVAAPATRPPVERIVVVPPGRHGATRDAIKNRLAADASLRLGAADIGYYMDVMEARLRQLATRGLGIERRDTRLVITLSGMPSFESGSSRLTDDARASLTPLAAALREYRKTLVSIHGHTDATGNATVNQGLSEERALAVARALVSEGIIEDRLVVVGHGAALPVASNDTDAGRERNRRAELHLDPITSGSG